MDSISFQGTARRSASGRVGAPRATRMRRDARIHRMDNISVPQAHRGIKSRRVDSRVVAFNVDYRDATRCARETSDGDVSRFTASGGPLPLQLDPYDLPLDLWRGQTLAGRRIRQEKVIDSTPGIDRVRKSRRSRQRPPSSRRGGCIVDERRARAS